MKQTIKSLTKQQLDDVLNQILNMADELTKEVDGEKILEDSDFGLYIKSILVNANLLDESLL